MTQGSGSILRINLCTQSLSLLSQKLYLNLQALALLLFLLAILSHCSSVALAIWQHSLPVLLLVVLLRLCSRRASKRLRILIRGALLSLFVGGYRRLRCIGSLTGASMFTFSETPAWVGRYGTSTDRMFVTWSRHSLSSKLAGLFPVTEGVGAVKHGVEHHSVESSFAGKLQVHDQALQASSSCCCILSCALGEYVAMLMREVQKFVLILPPVR
mmetsp:Transcript_41926/g.80201  ORF Transcript_41926/g.80201 Transcript_41926/m.80201 type:complete len:214 (-) Transcript_41926:135-776(-)